MSQAANFIDNAVFNGVNLLDTAGASPDVNTLSNLDGGTLTLSGQDLRTTINSLAGATLATATNAQDILDAQYSNLASPVNSALGALGAEVRALELQTSFLEQIPDATEAALGNHADADSTEQRGVGKEGVRT